MSAWVARVRAPVLLVASARDGMVSMADSRRVASAARDPRWLRADDLRHDGLLAGVVERGELTGALRALAVPAARPTALNGG
jgi:fermentation-respiration switch protein FrsA (DUF1100 family)